MTADAYRAMALGYDPATAFFLDPVRRLVGRTLRELGARRVLDVCCGTGRQTLLLRREELSAVGIDASPAMLTVARRKTQSPVPFARMDARTLGFPDASFDAACITLALHENSEADRLAMAREMLRVTRPGGHLLVVDYLAPLHFSPMGVLVLLAERLAGREHFRNYRDFVFRKGVSAFVQRLGLRTPAPAVPVLGGQAALVVASVGVAASFSSPAHP